MPDGCREALVVSVVRMRSGGGGGGSIDDDAAPRYGRHCSVGDDASC